MASPTLVDGGVWGGVHGGHQAGFAAHYKRIFHVFKMFQKNVAILHMLHRLHMLRRYVASVLRCCIFIEMFHVNFKCFMKHEIDVATDFFSQPKDG